MKQKLSFVILIALCLALFSCYSYTDPKDYLYDKVGFDPGRVPNSSDPRLRQEAPDYYYRYGPTVPVSNYAPQPQYQYAPQQYSPYPARPYQPYQAPGSRFYSNPYEVPPSPYQRQPYDADQYYVPPSGYYDQQEQRSGDNINKSAIHY